jgi:hypothetical protein
MLCLQIESFKLGNKAISAFLKTKSMKKDPPRTEQNFLAYRKWLYAYLEWFDPSLLEYLKTEIDGITVHRLPNHLAADDL